MNFQNSSKSFWQMKRPNTIFMFKIEKKILFQFLFSKSKNDPPPSLKPIKKNINVFFSSIKNPIQTNGFIMKTFLFFFFRQSDFLFQQLTWSICDCFNSLICVIHHFFFIERSASIFFFIFCKCYKKTNKKKFNWWKFIVIMFFFSLYWFTMSLNYDWYIWKNNFTSQCAKNFIYKTDFFIYEKTKKIENNKLINVIVFIVVVAVLIENWNNKLKIDLFCFINFEICNQLKKSIWFLFYFHVYWPLNWL